MGRQNSMKMNGIMLKVDVLGQVANLFAHIPLISSSGMSCYSASMVFCAAVMQVWKSGMCFHKH